ncbi:haloacid dehalogenase [Lewinellaceae bacterium SD302]|nr:haloacid dehalogenase [Lewinellaceae bacterium SD302]
MIDPGRITHIAFDADDTLWAHENVFVDAKKAATELLRPYLGEKDIEKELYRFEKKNLAIFGYGIKGFMLSLIETAIELSSGKISGGEIQRIIDLGKEMLEHPIELLTHVSEAIDLFEDHYPLLIITKGDLFDQENKIARSGIGDHFSIVEIVSEKNPKSYRKICRKHEIDPRGLLMLGNSLKSDILPVLEIGGQAIHIPFEYTWHHERTEADKSRDGLAIVESLEEAVNLVFPGVV